MSVEDRARHCVDPDLYNVFGELMLIEQFWEILSSIVGQQEQRPGTDQLIVKTIFLTCTQLLFLTRDRAVLTIRLSAALAP